MGDAAVINPACVRGDEKGNVRKGQQNNNVSAPLSGSCRAMINSAQQVHDGVRKPPPVAGVYASSRLPHRVQRGGTGVSAHLQSVPFPLLLPLGVTGYPAVSQYSCLDRQGVPPTPSAAYVHPDNLSVTSVTYTGTRTRASRGCASSTSADGKLSVIKDCKPDDDGLPVGGIDNNCGKTRSGYVVTSGCQASGISTTSQPPGGRRVQQVPYFVYQGIPSSSHFERGSPFPLLFTDPPVARRSDSTPSSRPAVEKNAPSQLLELSTSHSHGPDKLNREELPRLLRSPHGQRTLHGHRQAKPREMLEPCIADIRVPPVQGGNVLFCSYCRTRLVKRKNYMPCWPEFLLCDTCALLPHCSVCHRKALPAYISLGRTFSDCDGLEQTDPRKSSTAESSSIQRSPCSSDRCHIASSTTSSLIAHNDTCIIGERSTRVGSDTTRKGDKSEESTRDAEGRHPERSPADKRKCGARDTTRIRCEPLHDAEGLHLCGHCALLNPVNTKESLLRLTQYALRWLQERHGLVFSEERLAVQKLPLVQQRMRESLLRHDRWHRSVSTPEVLVQHTVQHDNKTNNMRVSCTSEESHGSRLEIECSPRLPAHPLCIESTESVRPRRRQAPRESYQTGSAASEAASWERKATAVQAEGKDDVYMMQMLIQSIQQLCHSEEAARQYLTKRSVHPAPREQNGGSHMHGRHQASPTEEKHNNHAHGEHFRAQEPNHTFGEEEGSQRSLLSNGNLGFRVEAVGYTKLNVREKSNVFGRCETERLPYDDLLLHLRTQEDRTEQRRALQQAVQVSREDAFAASAAAGSERSAAMQRRCSKTLHTSRYPKLLPTAENQECSLNCIRCVSVLRCLPETVFLSHLVHELVHAYIGCGQPMKERMMPLQIEEGICNAVAASFLHERLEMLTIWEAQLADARGPERRMDLHASLQDSAVGGNAKETTTRDLYMPVATQQELPKFQTAVGFSRAAPEGEDSRGCLTPADKGTTAVDAHASTAARRQGVTELDEETDMGREKREELLLLLVRYEARVLRTRLNEMETDEHYCYGKGYRVMRRIMEDIQLQQTLRVAAQYGSSLEAVEQAAASLRSRESCRSDRNPGDCALGWCIASSSNTVSVKRETGNVPSSPQVKARSYASSQDAGGLRCKAGEAPQSKSSCEAGFLEAAEQQLRSQQQIRGPATLYEASVDATAGGLHRSQPIKQDKSLRERKQMRGVPVRTRETGPCSLALPDAKLQSSRTQPVLTRGKPLKTLTVTSAARIAASELLETVYALFWQRKPSARKHDTFEESATSCWVVAHMGREREHPVTATASG